MTNLDNQTNDTLKLDFNERSDKLPVWLSEFKVPINELWRYPSKEKLQLRIGEIYKLEENQLLITNGGDEAIDLMFKWAKLNGYKLILPLPIFSQYWIGKDNWKFEHKTIEPLSNLNIDQNVLLESIEKNSIVVITSPNNPTGETLSVNEIRTICHKAKENNAYVFLDCAYIEFTQLEEGYLGLIDEFDNLMILRTLSKAYGLAAIRVGYLLGSTRLISQLNSLSLPFNISKPNLDLALLAFTKEARQEVKDYCNQVNSNRQQIINYLSRFALETCESQANFLLIKGDKKRLKMIEAACTQLRISIKTNLIGLSGNRSINAIRIAIPYDSTRLLTAFKLALEPELICFDMDGVLIDTSKSYDQAVIKTVESFTGVKPTTADVLDIRAKGGFNNDWSLSQKLINEHGINTKLDEIIPVFQSFYLGTDAVEGLFNEEKALIQRSLSNEIFARRSKSLCTAIVTGRGKDEAKSGLNLLQIFNTVLISDDDVIKSKPDPEGIIKAKNYYKKDLIWTLGDAPDDMIAAKAAGALAIGIGNESLYKFGADIVLDNVNDLEELL